MDSGHPIGHFLGVMMTEHTQLNIKKQRKRNQIKIYAKIVRSILLPIGAKHSPSESPLGGNIGKPGGPTLCGPGPPLDRFGAKHSPSDSTLGVNIGKPWGPPLCVAWTPLDRFFSH